MAIPKVRADVAWEQGTDHAGQTIYTAKFGGDTLRISPHYNQKDKWEAEWKVDGKKRTSSIDRKRQTRAYARGASKSVGVGEPFTTPKTAMSWIEKQYGEGLRQRAIGGYGFGAGLEGWEKTTDAKGDTVYKPSAEDSEKSTLADAVADYKDQQESSQSSQGGTSTKTKKKAVADGGMFFKQPTYHARTGRGTKGMKG